MMAFTRRNILLYFRDKTAVFFSLLAVMIVILLYGLFLGDLTAKEMPDFPGKETLLTTWIMAGILAITSMTTTLGAFGILVDDQANQTHLDFYATPIPRIKLVAGYICSAIIIGVVMCIVVFLIADIYLLINGHGLLEWDASFLMLGLILLAVCSSCSMVLLIVSFLKTSNAFAAASMMIGTLIGFLAGIYIPIGNFPSYLQTIVKVFPVSHVAALFRQLFMENSLGEAFVYARAEEINFLRNMGVRYTLGEETISNMLSITYLIATTSVFFGWAFLRLRKKMT